jgi:uncharacterized protein (TIGR00299 family) protein
MHIQLDPVGGMAGDMFVAAMLDAFPGLETAVQGAVRAAGLPVRFRCDLVAHTDHALSGRKFLVLEGRGDPSEDTHELPQLREVSGPQPHAPDHHHGHRPFAEIRDDLTRAPIDPGIRGHALAIFTALAEVEAQVHGSTTDTVTFHELGEWDSIADIVAAAAVIHALSPATWSVGPLPLGQGFVESAHGRLPVPAPATALLLRGLTTCDDGIGGERVTPTGAAIVRHLVGLPGKAPRERLLLRSGFGFGTRALPRIANCVRALVFDPAPDPRPEDRITSIEFEVDDQTPEDLAIGLDHVRSHPHVLDVLQIPALGKKGRVAVSVRVLCLGVSEDEIASLCFIETTTLGVRFLDVRRKVLPRSASTVNVLDRHLGRKQAYRGASTTMKVEADSLREVAGHEAREYLRRAGVSVPSRD